MQTKTNSERQTSPDNPSDANVGKAELMTAVICVSQSPKAHFTSNAYDVLIETTRGRRKSHSSFGYNIIILSFEPCRIKQSEPTVAKGAMNAPEAPSTVRVRSISVFEVG